MRDEQVPVWLEAARRHIGQQAIKGPQVNPYIVGLYATSGHPEIHDDETPWCAGFINGCLAESGIAGTGSLLASSFSSYGVRLNEGDYRIGAIVVLDHHVGVLDGVDADGRLRILGGNQGHSKGVSEVSVSRYKPESVRALIWPYEIKTPSELQADGSKQAAKGQMDIAAGWAATLTGGAASVAALDKASTQGASLLEKVAGNPWPWLACALGVYLISTGHLSRLWRAAEHNLGSNSRLRKD